jgi:hypothetical protein
MVLLLPLFLACHRLALALAEWRHVNPMMSAVSAAWLGQVLLDEGPTTYAITDMKDAAWLAQKIVTDYGMTDLGITTYAFKHRNIALKMRSFEVGRSPQLPHAFWHLLPSALHGCEALF